MEPEEIKKRLEALLKAPKRERIRVFINAGILDEDGYLSRKTFSKKTVDKHKSKGNPIKA